MKKPVRVLIVEDVEDDARLLVAELRRGGYEVDFERVDTAAAMRNALQQEKWDLILCDFTMPYFSGTAALQMARDSGTDAPFIFVSGTIGEDIATEAMKSGAHDYIMKTSLARLAPAVERELREAALRRENRLAAAAMRESEHKYRHLFEALSDAVFLIDEASGKIIDTNVQAQNLLGRTRTEILGSNQSQLFVARRERPAFDTLCAAASGEQPGGCELEVFQREGRILPVQASASRIELYGRSFLLAVLRDVSERNRMDGLLRQLSRAVEQSPASIVITDLDGNITYVNSKFTVLTGYSFAEVAGKKPRFLQAEQMPPGFHAQLWRTITSGQEWRGEFQNVKKSGETCWESTSISPIFNEAGGITHYLAVCEDITSRKQAEESYARLALAVEHAAETVMITDTNGTILYVNPVFEKTSGYTRAEALGQSPRLLKSGRHDAEFYRLMWDTLQRGESWVGRIVNQRKDGKLYEEEATISPVRDARGQVVNYVAVKRDVTRELQLEAQFLQAQKMEGIGQLAGGVAHDFNNILTVIMMQVQLARMVPNTPGEVRESLLEINAAADRAANLTRQLLMFSRQQVMQPRLLDLNEVVTCLAKMLQRVIHENVHLQLNLHVSPLPVYADEGMLDQVLLNLAVNARDAMPAGGRLIIETAEKVIDARQAELDPESSPGRYVWLSVSDTGCGIPPEVLPHILEPFFTTKEAGKGTGLGLATVFGIVKQHHGWLKVYSEVGKGATVQIFLPASDLSADEFQNREKAAPAPRGGSETILVVEDDCTVRAPTRTVLERSGYVVLEAADGTEAERVWAEHHGQIALLLTDIVMPGQLDGLELAARLQTQKPGLKVVFTSGYSADIAGRELKLRAGQNFVQKPCPPRRLLEVVRDCLDS
jgi:two-component system, cell cycle sensor histidine kinase and response regulator CckA